MMRPRTGQDRPDERPAPDSSGEERSANFTREATTATHALVHDARLPEYARVGHVLFGKYRVERLLGRGGMGVVILARHLQLLEPVAIKFLLPEYRNAESVERFMREAWAATKVKSEYVVRVTDVGTLPEGAPYLVMEYMEGEDLASTLKRGEPLSIQQVAEFLLQMCEALAEAHVLGIVHRDLKPSNVFKVLRSDGLHALKVLDFGISKVSHPALHVPGPAMTTSSVTMGSPSYMSPEQMRSTRDVDLRTDIWALGAIAYEMLAGRVPFEAMSFPELAVKIATQQPEPLRSQRRDVPRRLEQVIGRCLEKSRDARYADVGQLARDLIEFAPAHAQPHADRVTRVLRASSAKSSDTPKLDPPRRAPFEAKRVTASLTVAVIATAVSFWWWTVHRQPDAVRPVETSVVAPIPRPTPPEPRVEPPAIAPTPAPTPDATADPPAKQPIKRAREPAKPKRKPLQTLDPDEELGGRI